MAQNKEVTDVIILTNKNLESKARLIKLILKLRRSTMSGLMLFCWIMFVSGLDRDRRKPQYGRGQEMMI